ncbi:MAG: copper-translocating P-type ATPase [Saprospiraceae bacterium]|nr:copper-translocating P-type ATPase [Saprospiraceae bacterium]
MSEDHDHSQHHDKHDHGEHHRKMIRDFRKRFWVTLALTIPILLLSPLIQSWLGVDWRFNYDRYLAFGLSSVVFFYGGWPFLKGLIDELSDRSPGMMTLIGVAIIVAYGYSSAVVFGLEGKTFFWELSTLILVMLLGHWIEMKSVLGASRALEKLIELMPDDAHLIEEGETRTVEVSELKTGDLILIKPGEKVPVDGEVEEGEGEMNESMLTGESKPVPKEPGDEVIGGAVNGNSSLKVRVKKTGEDSYLSKVVAMVKDAQSRKSKTQRLADRAAFWLTVVALSVGTLTLLAWLLLGDRPFVFALERMVTVMVITCPHALGLAIPLVAAISTSISARNGLLIRNRTAFENSRRIDTLVFDKTGTLTTGEFGVNSFASVTEVVEDDEVLRLAAALESESEHPLARGIMGKIEEMDLEVPEAKDFEAITGKGVRARVADSEIMVVSPAYLEENGIDKPSEAPADTAETVVFVLREKEVIGYVALSDQIREESQEAIDTLKENDIRTVMLTGDNESVARKVAEQLGIDSYFAEVLPDQKLEKIKELQEEGAFVAMTGDGVNDAPALAQADVGIAVGSGTDVAAETADIILVESDPKDIAQLILFGKATYRKMVQNLFWATAYNVVAIPLAAGVLYQQGIMISPAFGAALMSLSTVVVAINAQLLKREIKKK